MLISIAVTGDISLVDLLIISMVAICDNIIGYIIVFGAYILGTNILVVTSLVLIGDRINSCDLWSYDCF